MTQVEIIDTSAIDIHEHAFCGFQDSKHEGHRRKANWLKKRFVEGMKFKVLQVDGKVVAEHPISGTRFVNIMRKRSK